MAKSTPIEVIKQQKKAENVSNTVNVSNASNALNTESDDNVNDVLNSLNAKQYVTPDSNSNQLLPPPPIYDPYIETMIEENNDDDNTSYLSHLMTTDVKLSVLCAIVFIIVYSIPIERIVFTYISIDKLPFSEIIIKGLIAGTIFFILARLIT